MDVASIIADKQSVDDFKANMRNRSDDFRKRANKINNYRVVPADLKDKHKRKLAYKEVEALQEGILTNYKDWANEAVNYNNFDKTTGQSLVENGMRSANDAFTASTIANCLDAFSDGMTLSSIFSCIISYKMAGLLNPSFKQDISRMYLNMRDDLSQTAKSSVLGKAFMFNCDNYLMKRSTAFSTAQIESSLRHNNLDSMVMTPRQVAAIKLNFMEQYYHDVHTATRKNKSQVEIDAYKNKYDIALDHLNAIAINSGFDMTVVAAEEKYLVGLNIEKNPNYANMFRETRGMYGVRPAVDKDGQYSGNFKTRDDKLFSYAGDKNGSSIRNGAFTVMDKWGLSPNNERSLDVIRKDIMFYGATVAAMKLCVENSDADFGKGVSKRDVLKRIERFEDEYKASTVKQLQFERGMSGIKADQFFEKTFRGSYYEFYDAGGNKAHSNDIKGFNQTAFDAEFNRLFDKKLLNIYNIAYPDVKRKGEYKANYSQWCSECNDVFRIVAKKNPKVFPEAGDYDHERMRKFILDNRSSLKKDMTAEEWFDSLLHAGANAAMSYSIGANDVGLNVSDSKENDDKLRFRYDILDSIDTPSDISSLENEIDHIPVEDDFSSITPDDFGLDDLDFSGTSNNDEFTII